MAWEYKTEAVGNEALSTSEARLNTFGADGWELVCVERGYFIFKRETVI